MPPNPSSRWGLWGWPWRVKSRSLILLVRIYLQRILSPWSCYHMPRFQQVWSHRLPFGVLMQELAFATRFFIVFLFGERQERFHIMLKLPIRQHWVSPMSVRPTAITANYLCGTSFSTELLFCASEEDWKPYDHSQGPAGKAMSQLSLTAQACTYSWELSLLSIPACWPILGNMIVI